MLHFMTSVERNCASHSFTITESGAESRPAAVAMVMAAFPKEIRPSIYC